MKSEKVNEMAENAEKYLAKKQKHLPPRPPLLKARGAVYIDVLCAKNL